MVRAAKQVGGSKPAPILAHNNDKRKKIMIDISILRVI
jgi:hypothetical protein